MFTSVTSGPLKQIRGSHFRLAFQSNGLRFRRSEAGGGGGGGGGGAVAVEIPFLAQLRRPLLYDFRGGTAITRPAISRIEVNRLGKIYPHHSPCVILFDEQRYRYRSTGRKANRVRPAHRQPRQWRGG